MFFYDSGRNFILPVRTVLKTAGGRSISFRMRQDSREVRKVCMVPYSGFSIVS